jgi:phage shock protein A
MGDEASKRDLQALQVNVNKQIGDLKKQIADLEKAISETKTSLTKDIEDDNRTTVTVNQNLGKRIDGVDAQISQLQGLVGGLSNKIDRLEK